MVAWDEQVNMDAYGLDISGGDNLVTTEFESGKKRSYKKNSVGKKIFSFNLRMYDIGSNSEFKRFVMWWDNVLHSGAETFAFPDLLNRGYMTEYRVTESYSANGQKWKEVSLSVEEA